jgi:phenylpropionate dioxygenase-like ring-hydroxylating dioxygenase large terminal subunit
MIERMLWHPVALSDDVAGKPVPVHLMGEAMVL